jgi:hypothetical protein
VGPFSLDNGTFDGNVVDLVVIISMLSFDVEVCV